MLPQHLTVGNGLFFAGSKNEVMSAQLPIAKFEAANDRIIREAVVGRFPTNGGSEPKAEP